MKPPEVTADTKYSDLKQYYILRMNTRQLCPVYSSSKWSFENAKLSVVSEADRTVEVVTDDFTAY